MRDFAFFVGWHEDLRHYCDLLAETLAENGEPTLRWDTSGAAIEGSPPVRNEGGPGDRGGGEKNEAPAVHLWRPGAS